jgi:hypothetical protein
MDDLIASYPQLDPRDIQQFEANQGISFPEAYREFLLGSNGGRPPLNNVLEVPDWPFQSTVISYFFGLNTGDSYDLLDNMVRYQGRIPRICVPIADDAGGNILCLVVDGDQSGSIFFWDHENESENPDSFDNMYRVASNVKELFAKLHA